MTKLYVVTVDEVDDDGIVEDETIIVGVYSTIETAESVMEQINASDLPLLAEIEEWTVDQPPVIPDVLGDDDDDDGIE